MTCAAKTVTVQISPGEVGVRIDREGGRPAGDDGGDVRVPLVAQTIWNQLPATFTGSLNVTSRFVSVATLLPVGGRCRQ